MQRAEAAEKEKEANAMKIPEEISIRENRLQGIAEAKEKITARVAERYAVEKEQ